MPFHLSRFDSRWEISNRGAMTLERPPSDYFKRNIWITTTGVCADAPLRCAMEMMGSDRVMFSADYPFERPEEAGAWIEAAPISAEERRMVCHDNAAALLKL